MVRIDFPFSFFVHTAFVIFTRSVVNTRTGGESSSSNRRKPSSKKRSVSYHSCTPVRSLFDGGRRARLSPLAHLSLFVSCRFTCRFYIDLVSDLLRCRSSDRFTAFVRIEEAPSTILGSSRMPLSSTCLSLAVDHGAHPSKTCVLPPCSLLRRRFHVSEAFVPRFEGR